MTSSLYYSLFPILFVYESIAEIDNDLISNEYHHTSCLELPDGEHYIRPIRDDYANNYNHMSFLPSIKVRCFEGWTILDYSLDSNIENYFSSTMQVHDGFLTMDVSKEHLNWDEWFKIDNVVFSTSTDCQSCDYDPADPTASNAYYMTGNYYGCAFATKGIFYIFCHCI